MTLFISAFRALKGGVAKNCTPRLSSWSISPKQRTPQLDTFSWPSLPREEFPIPDFRTIENKRIKEPTPNLLETIYICQQRQEWYRNFALSTKEAPLNFVGSATVRDKIEAAAENIRAILGFSVEERRIAPTWTDALRRFIELTDKIGVLVMVNGVVGNNNYRKLDADEFRGFALSDSVAPLIFINGADTKAAQIFTLAHELAHIWLGQSALSDVAPVMIPINEVELWCNRVAAEILVPLNVLQRELRKDEELRQTLDRLARQFKVSTLVVLRRMFDAGALTKDQMWKFYEEELSRLLALPKSSGGDFYLTQGARVGKKIRPRARC